MERNWKRWAFIGVGVIALVGVLVGGWLLTRPRGDARYESVTIHETIRGDYGVGVDSAYQVSLGFFTNENALRGMLQVDPAVDYALDGGGRNWTLTPSEPLERNQVYTFRVVDQEGATVRSFAFQTESDLLVQAVYPRDGQRYVQNDTGIQISFNAEGVDPSGFVTLQPEVAGTWSTNGYTAVFLPAKPLDMNSVYRVSLKAGITASNGMQLTENYAFAFETEDSDSKAYETRLRLSGDYAETFLTGDPVVVQLYSEDLSGVPFHMSVYRLPGIEAYARAVMDYDVFYRERYGLKRDYWLDTTGLELISETTEELTTPNRFWTNCYATLPEGLPPGYYAIDLAGVDQDGREQQVQKLVQVCDLSVYTQSAEGETLVWLNSPVDGQPLANMRIDLLDCLNPEQTRGGVTDTDGLALLDTGKIQKSYLTISTAGKPLYFAKMDLSAPSTPSLSQQYYSAVYTDREIYQPTDTVQFWGVLSPRDNQMAMPKSAKAVLWYGQESEMAVSQLVIAENGTYRGTLSLEQLDKGWYEFALQNEQGEVYLSHTIKVAHFTKPAYVINTKTSKDWYYYDEPIDLSVNAAYFDKQPAQDVTLQLDCYMLGTRGDSDNEIKLALDEQGNAHYTGRFIDEELNNCYPSTEWYTLSSADPEDVIVSSSEEILVAYSKNLVEAESETPGTLTIRSAKLNEERVVRDDWSARRQPDGRHLTSFEWYGAGATDLPLTVEVHRSRNTKVPVSQYYDEVLRKVVTQYDYQWEETVVETIQTATVGGVVTLAIDPSYFNTDEDYYWPEVIFSNGMGQQVRIHFQFYGNGNMTSKIKNYSFVDPEQRYNNVQAALDEPVQLGLYDRGKPVQNEGRVLYSVIQGARMETGFYTEDTHELTFAQRFIPNVSVRGAYFDGRHIYRIQPLHCDYDYTEQTLNVAVKAAQEANRPGDEVELTVTLTDPQGKPVAGSACVGVVDESVFALVDQQLDIAQQLYASVFYTDAVEHVSYQEYNLEQDPSTGGMGGGGGDEASIRQDFVDTALFEAVEVDASGTAHVTVTMPDNITSWRLTAAAVTPDLKGGAGVGSTVVTLPFYLRPLVTDTYLVGDDVTVSARGVAEQEPSQMTVKAQLCDAQGNQVQVLEKAGEIGQNINFQFGKLPAGEYKVVFTGQNGEHKDLVEEPFTVILAGLAVPVEHDLELSALTTVESARYPVQVTIYDKSRTLFVEGLRMLTPLLSERTETLAAGHMARVLQNELLDPEDRLELEKDWRLRSIQDYESGVRPLSSSEPEAAVTTKMLLMAPELIQKDYAKIYLYEVLRNPASEPDARVMAKVGLAALHEPVLLDLRWMLENEELTTMQRLYGGAGLAALGDEEGARAVYEQLMPKPVIDGESLLVQGEDADQTRINTGAALVLTSMIQHPDSDGLMRYLCAQRKLPDTKELVDLEMYSYLRYFRARNKTKASFSYQTDDGKQTVDLGEQGIWTTWMSRSQFQQAAFQTGKGDIRAAVRASQLVDTAPEATSSVASVEKIVTPIGGSLATGRRARVELIITFQDDAPYGDYYLYDWIPAGMRYQESGDSMMPFDEAIWGQVDNEGQQVTAHVWRGKPNGIEVLTLGSGAPNPGTSEVAFAESSSEQSEPDPQVGGLEDAPLENPSTDGVIENPSTDDVMENPSTDGEEPNPGSTDTVETDNNVLRLVYYVACVLPGEYVSEGVWFQMPDSGTLYHAERGTATIQ